jgi:hypothetical protein
MKKILKSLRQMAEKKAIWKYAIVHAQNESRARTYAEKITEMTGMNPAFVVDVSPVLGVHTGIGTLAVALMFQ